jgi:valyl-tRNA synthetase
VSSLKDSYDTSEETKWQEKWQEWSLYEFDPDSDKPIYSIDTPPPYVSGDLHIGHAMSYGQAEFVARFKRMQGFEVFYPMGFDDNGLPTERYVQRELDIDKHDLGRTKFIEKCREVTSKGRDNYREVWNRLGVSVDWNLSYTTIDERSREISQRSFKDMYEKDRIYREEDPVIWCPECQTGLAQADLEDEEEKSQLNHIKFYYKNRDGGLKISTTRPELIQACVGIVVHPDDERYQDLIGEEIEVPLTDKTVEIMSDHRVDRDFGSGAVMTCTFGDQTDIEWWKELELDTEIIINRDGTLNDKSGKYQGMTTELAREEILEDLEDKGHLLDQESIEHTIKIHERCDHSTEFFPTEQWFAKQLDIKEELKIRGEDINWFPNYMQGRFEDWTDGLKWDWCISRQRFYGVPFPVWFCESCGEEVIADDKRMPVDPIEEEPGIEECPKCGSTDFEGDNDVMDTWFTSSLTPLINARWGMKDERMDIYPMDLRPQAYDIIRTWAYYTILKSDAHTDKIPWKDIMISGMGLMDEGKDFSKSKNRVIKPEKVAEEYSADALRWWSSKVKLGEDLVFDQKDLEAGQRLIDKLWNAAKFTEQFIEEKPENPGDLSTIDKWLLQKRDEVIEEVTERFRDLEYDKSKEIVREFFWHDLADEFIEIQKQKLYEEDEAAVYTLYTCLFDTIKMLAPIIPHITEEIYQKIYREYEDEKSIHISDWPEPRAFEFQKERREGENLIELISNLRKYKTENGMALNEEIERIEIYSDKEIEKNPLKRAMNIQEVKKLDEKPELSEKITEISLNYSKAGPKYGKKVGEIEEAIENGEWSISDGKLEVCEETLDEEIFSCEKDLDSDRKGDLIETGSGIMVVKY